MIFICLEDVLNSEDLSSLRERAESLEYAPGAETAGWHARQVKENRQAQPSAALRQIQREVIEHLKAHTLFGSAVLPKAFAPPLIVRSGPGETYGTHVDDALMGIPVVRSDVSVTLFLSEPDEYEGGELVMESRSGEEAFKLPAGSAIIYPSTTLHRVEPVTAGERLVAVTWVESHVRDPGGREILLDIDEARRDLFLKDGKTANFDKLSRAYANLLRKWAE